MNARDLTAIEWRGDERGSLRLLDQRVLPERETWLECTTVGAVADAIRTMAVRGAPAIGITAAYGMALAHRETSGDLARLQQSKDELAATRPTAVNLFWALERCWRAVEGGAGVSELLDLARQLHRDDIEGNVRIGHLGTARIDDGMGILTHCNAGVLATGGFGTALAPIFVAHEQGKRIHVFVDETRPRLQGARLTAWELSKVGVPYTLICDSMAASLMREKKIQACITGADRIAANGDTANKIGTYSVAVNARHHEVPFFVAAPRSTFDLAIPDGSRIPIEERDATEVTAWGPERTCPATTTVFNPAFDVTPADMIHAIFTDAGEIAPVDTSNVGRVVKPST